MRRLALAFALLTSVLGIRFGAFAVGGADSYGYVSQADLWLRRTLIIEQPLGRDAPWRAAVWTLAPLGYLPGDERGTMVPLYAPGLPILMAAFKALGGENAVYYVVPLLGGLGVWLTFVLGRHLAGPAAGALAAAALAASPVFLFQLMLPMSDVPVMTWWLVSIVLALGLTPWHAAAAGAAASVAILTRPNLVILAAPIVALVALRHATWRAAAVRGVVCGLLIVPGVLAVAAINQHLYESAMNSGYGRPDTIFAFANLWPNLTRYPRWLLETQTPFVVLALAAPALLARNRDAGTAPLARWGLAFACMVLLAYIWYTPFDHWTYLRFLLPAYPVVLALAAASFAAIAPRVPKARAWAFLVVAVTVAGWGLWRGEPAFHIREGESRYRTAGRFAKSLPENAVVLSNQHSGSLRHYANRVTLRFEWLAPEAYDEALTYLRRAGYRIYAVLDDFERDVFRRRYGSVADLSWLEEEPLMVVPGRVYFYQVPTEPLNR